MRTPGLYEGLSNTEYHQDKEWLSSSQLKVALISAKAFKHTVIDGKGKKKASDSKDFGSVVHKLTLEPHDFHNEYEVADLSGLDFRKPGDRKKLEDMRLLAGDKTLIDKETYDDAYEAHQSLLSHPDIKRDLSLPGKSELSLYVVMDHMLPGGEIVPVKIRVRFDRIVPGVGIYDIKTDKNPSKEAFKKTVSADWGCHYDLSAYMYQLAWKQYSGELLPFKWHAVRNESPWEPACYIMSEETRNKGKAKFERALNTIIMAERAGVWEMQTREEEI
jgi:hypothetical protein